MFKCHYIKSNHRSVGKNKVGTYCRTSFAIDYSAPVLADKLCANSYEHSMYIRYLWFHQLFSIFGVFHLSAPKVCWPSSGP